jgi:tetratricopeptide (TPR) repeat protein
MFRTRTLTAVVLLAFLLAPIVAGDAADDLISKGHVYESAGRYDEALASFNEAVLLKPQESYVYLPKVDILNKLGYFEEAYQAGQQVFDNLPTSTEPIYYYQFVSGGSMMCADYHTKGKELIMYHQNYEQALFYFNRVHELCPNDTDIGNVYSDEGYALYKLGRYEESLQAYDAALHVSQVKLASDPKRREYIENNLIFNHNRQMIFNKINPTPSATVTQTSGLTTVPTSPRGESTETGNADYSIAQGLPFPWIYSIAGIGIGFIVVKGRK